MRNLKSFFVIALVAATAFFSCSTGDDSPAADDGSLKGTITIQQYGSPVTTAYTWTPLSAIYSGTETGLSYQWMLNAAPVGTGASFTPEEVGSYTVTVSAPGKISKTSAPVNVTANPILQSLTGTVLFFIESESDPVTETETGQEITAVYEGSEQETFSYQWFKGGVALQSYATTTQDSYTPIEPGSYTVRLTASGYVPFTSDPVEVTGPTLLTITFDPNGPDEENITRIIAPGTPLETLPLAPVYNGFTFQTWYTTATGPGALVTESSTFTESTTVYARWIFAGGTPYEVEDEDEYGGVILVHPNPKMTAGQGFTGTISTDDGTVRYTAGAFQYMFPMGDNFNVGDYVYFVVRFELSSPAGNGSGVSLRQYGSSNFYGGFVENDERYPWLSNTTSSGIKFLISGSGDSKGFALQYNGGTTEIVVRITSITYYKLALHTVTFNLDGGNGSSTPKQAYHGYTLGANFPANPTRTDYTFMGWKNAAGTVVTSTTAIMDDWELTAQWMLTSELPTPEDVVSGNGTLFAVSGGSTAAKFSYDGKQWWVFAKTPPGTPAAVAPFDGAAASDYTAALAEATRVYTRVNYSLPSLSEIWQSFPKVTLTYDLIMVGGSDRSITVRNGVGAGGEPSPGNPAFQAGSGNTITFNTSDFGTGNLALVKNNTGVDSLFLIRITKVELHLDN